MSLCEKKVNNTTMVKALDEDKKLFTSIVIKANQYDNDGKNEDFWSYEVTEQACHDFMLKCQQGNLSHVIDTDMVKVVESYIAPCDFEMGEGKVEKGDWVMTTKILDDGLWEMCKEGLFKGYSIGCGAIVEEE